jgi:hypothetical protein
MPSKTKELIDKADALKIEISQIIQATNQCLFECWELILAEEGLPLLD